MVIKSKLLLAAIKNGGYKLTAVKTAHVFMNKLTQHYCQFIAIVI